jgi:excisionase family DNA binding protein
MGEPAKTPFDAMLDAFRQVVREEIKAALQSNNGWGARQDPPTDRAFLTVKQAAEVSGLGVSTIRLYIRRRQLRAQQVGRRVLIKRSDLATLLEADPIEVKDSEFCP